jgi:chromosome segregation ATPase
MIAGALMSLAEIDAELAALRPKIAAFDPKMEKLGNEMAQINRDRLDTGASRLPPRFDTVQAEHRRLAAQRAPLAVRLTELEQLRTRMEAELVPLRRDAARLEAQLASFAHLPPGLYELLDAAADGFAVRGDALSTHRAGALRAAAAVCQEPAQLRAKLARLNELRRERGDPDAAE